MYSGRFSSSFRRVDNADDAAIRQSAQEVLEAMTGEKYSSREEWESFVKGLGIRPEWKEKRESAAADALDPIK